MRLHLWYLEFSRVTQVVRARQRLIFLVIGALLLISGIALPSVTAVISGMLVMGSFAFDARPGDPTSAHVRMWQRLHKSG